MNKLIIIGGGPAGYETALAAKQAGLDVTLIEKETLGGVCLWEGCIPTKTLLHSAHLYQQMQKGDDFGVNASDVTLDFQKVQLRKNGLIFRLHEGIKLRLEQAQIPVIKGEAHVVDAHTVHVDQQFLSADTIMLATGSSGRNLRIPGSKLTRVLSAKQLLEVDEIPKRLIIIGSGVIGCEFASLFAAFGSEVTLLEAQPQILSLADSEITRRLQTAFKRQKIDVKTTVRVVKIEENENKSLQVHYLEKEQEKIVVGDYVLMAVGRQPNLDVVPLDQLKIAYNPSGIQVNAHFQTNIPSLYAIGDINGQSLLAHSAVFQGKAALHHLLKKPHQIGFDTTPNVIFTFPEIAFVGKKEEELIKGEYNVYKSLYTANAMAAVQEETYGFAKIITNLQGVMIGAHIIGKDASILIAEMVVALNNKMSLSAFRQVIHAHPTLAELWQDIK